MERARRVASDAGIELISDSPKWYFNGERAGFFIKRADFEEVSWRQLRHGATAGVLLGELRNQAEEDRDVEKAAFGEYLLRLYYNPEAEDFDQRTTYRLVTPEGETIHRGDADLGTDDEPGDFLFIREETENWRASLSLRWGGVHWYFDFNLTPGSHQPAGDGPGLLDPFLDYRRSLKRRLTETARVRGLATEGEFLMRSSHQFDFAVKTIPQESEVTWEDFRGGRPFALVALRNPGAVVYDGHVRHRFPAGFTPILARLHWLPEADPRPLAVEMVRPETGQTLFWGYADGKDGPERADSVELFVHSREHGRPEFGLAHPWFKPGLEAIFNRGVPRRPITKKLEEEE